MAKRKSKPAEPPQLRAIDGDDDSFGLPEINPQPLSQMPAEPAVSETTENSAPEPQREPVRPVYSPGETVEFTRPAEPLAAEYSKRPKAPVAIITGIIVLIVAVAGLLYWYVIKPHQEKARQELVAKQEREQREQERRAIEEEERRRREAAESTVVSEETKPAIGRIDTLAARSRRYHIVLASSIDADLIMDYAKRLSMQGTSTSLLLPFDKLKFTRLTMGNYATYASAQAAADAAKADLGNGLWVIRF